MELMELYNQIHNPIDDISVIEKLINAYANSSKGFGGYYGQLTKTVQKEHNKGQYYRNDVDRFYAMLFNKWKNSIVAMTRDEFVELYKRGSYGQDFIKMRNYLKNIPDVSTMKEADEIFYGNKGDKELEEALKKYSWKSFGEGSEWIHVCSRYLTAKKDQYPNVEHRLYLDTESLDTYKMTTYLVEKCDEHHLPYYFKFDQYADRDDTIVIYSSTENLTKYIEILQEIKREHPELVSRTKEPPVLTGKIDGWIGYGSEPAKTPDGKRHSFNEIRAKVLENSIGKVTKQWIMNHRNQQITYQGQKMLFQEYIAMKSTEKLISDLERKYIYYEENDKKVAQKNGTIYNPATVNDRLGYTLQDVRSPQFKQNIYFFLRDKMVNYLPKVCNENYKNMDAITMNVRNGKQIIFSGYDLETIIQQLSVNISKNDPNFISSVKVEIKNNAKQYGIDSDKFCFDISAREKMKMITVQREAQKQQNSTPIIQIPNFSELKDLASKYEIFFDSKDPFAPYTSKIKIRDIKTGQIQTDKSTIDRAMFANIWLTSAGVKYYQNESRPGANYAFNEPAEELYNTICKQLLDSCKSKGVIDTVDLLRNIENNNSYKYNREIIVNLFKSPYQTEIINKLFLQSLGINRQVQSPEPLYTMSYAGELVFDDANNNSKGR